jgi:glycerol-3-phosphate cytidylyltransferase-like family protein
VAMNSDESVRRLKGPGRPINPQGQRKSVLEALRCVDEVRVFDGDDARSLIEELKPMVLTNGFGYAYDEVVGRDLLEGYGGKVVITCTGDARDEPSTTKIQRRVLRATEIAGAVRAGAPYSVNPVDKLRLMADEFLKVAALPGDVADLGAYRGGTSLILRRLATDKHLHLFDNWGKGTPYDDPLCHHKKGEWACAALECWNVVGQDDRTHYHQGVFPASLSSVQIVDGNYLKFCFVYVDMDTEQATRDAIEFFWPRLVPGGKLFFDDWNHLPCAGVEKAIRESFRENELTLCVPLNACIVEKP